MNASRRLLYLASFFALATTSVVALARMGRPSIVPLLVWVVIVATLAGAPGLVRRRAWPAAFVLLLLGALFIVRTQMPVPSDVRFLSGQAGFYLDQLSSGARTYASHSFPMDLATAGDLKLLLSLVVFAIVGLAAFLSLSLRKALPAVVVLLVPLAFGLTVDGQDRAVGLVMAFVVFAGCMLLFSRALERRRLRSGDTATGLGTAAVAAIVALWIVGATSVAGSVPWQDWRTWDFSVGGEARFGFDSMEGYAGLLDPERNELVMRVRSPVATYWRANALNDFDGTAWFSGGGKKLRLDAEKKGDSFTYTVPAQDLVPPGTLVRQTFEIDAMQTDYFFTGGPAESLDYREELPVHASAASALGADRPLGPAFEYSVTAVVPELKPADLVGRGRDYPREVRRQTRLPFPTPADSAATATEPDWRRAMAESGARPEWLGLYRLNAEIVGDATDPYEIALRIERYLRFNYTYTLTPPAAKGRSPYAAFLLKTEKGFCQHFAGGMATLLRFNGVPARVAVGFATGLQVSDDGYVVSRNDAHAWVEVYFPGIGWVPFEPTPGQAFPGTGASSTSIAFTDPFADASGAPAAAAAGPEDDTPRGLQEDPTQGVASADSATTTEASPGAWLPWALGGGAVALLLAWPIGRALLRRRGLRRGTADARLRAALALFRADLADFGFEGAPSQTLEETAQLIRDHLDLDATPLVDRAQAVLFGGRTATAHDLAAAGEFRRDLRRRLRSRKGWWVALLAVYGLRAAPRAPRRRSTLPTRPRHAAARVGR